MVCGNIGLIDWLTVKSYAAEYYVFCDLFCDVRHTSQ